MCLIIRENNVMIIKHLSEIINLPNRLFRLPKRIFNAIRLLKLSSLQVGYVGWLGYQNLGDEALFQTISDLLSSASLFHYAPTPSEIRILRLLKKEKTFRAICLGGGTLIGSLSWLKIIQDALSHNIPVFSFGTGVLDPDYSTESNLYLDEWVELLSQFKEVSVRGYLSADLLGQLGIKDVKVVGDPLLALASETLVDASEDFVLGINVGQPLVSQSWGASEKNIIDAVAKNLKLLATKGWRYRLFSVIPDDEPVQNQLADLIGTRHIEYSKLYKDPNDFISDASKCCVFVGMKLHATILAYTAYTPVIMLEYQPKCRDFMFTVNRMDYNLRMDHITSNVLVDLVEQSRYYRRHLSQEQFEICQMYKQKLQSFADLMIAKMNSFNSGNIINK